MLNVNVCFLQKRIHQIAKGVKTFIRTRHSETFCLTFYVFCTFLNTRIYANARKEVYFDSIIKRNSKARFISGQPWISKLQ